MPLVQSSSKGAVSENIRREMDAGKPQRQSVAIALETQRRNRDAGGSTGSPWVDSTDATPFEIAARRQRRAVKHDQLKAGFGPADYAAGGFPRGFGMRGLPHPNNQKLTLGQQSAPPIGKIPALAKLPHLAQGGFVGFIPSDVPGRTDRHPVDVPSGSYVLPSEHVSSLGEGNSIAGGKILHDMFPHSESKESFSARETGDPMAHAADGGVTSGAAMGDDGGLVPVMVAGGEFIIDPRDVAAVGGGDLEKGHRELDQWVLLRRKKHIETLKRLPGPAQD